MTEISGKALSPHVVARTQINEWRGRCLDLFAQGERAIAALLENARDAQIDVKLHHLAGQRTKELAKLLDPGCKTKNQREAAKRVFEKWEEAESKRVSLAHGILTVAMDEGKGWYAIFDMVDYRSNAVRPIRLTVSRSEAEATAAELKTALTKLKAELGHIKKRLAPHPE